MTGLLAKFGVALASFAPIAAKWLAASAAAGYAWDKVRQEVYTDIKTGQLNEPFMAASIVLIWVIMLGATWPQRWLLWLWVIFWSLRGFVCR